MYGFEEVVLGHRKEVICSWMGMTCGGKGTLLNRLVAMVMAVVMMLSCLVRVIAQTILLAEMKALNALT